MGLDDATRSRACARPDNGFRRRLAPTGRMPMSPGSFAYHQPTSVSEAVALLADLGEEARPLAGGHSLIPMMKLRLATPDHLIDLKAIADLRGIRADGSD